MIVAETIKTYYCYKFQMIQIYLNLRDRRIHIIFSNYMLPIKSNVITVQGKISGRIYKTQDITQSPEGNKDGL